MNIKNIITYSDLRKKGFSSLEIKDDEVLLIKSKGESKCIVNQDFLMNLIKNQKTPELNTTAFFSSRLNSSENPIFDQKFLEMKNELKEDFSEFKKEISKFLENKDEGGDK